jgi:D-alanyl-lipoteichoic acid acyltransferase DltB (MBOAT superfamily)
MRAYASTILLTTFAIGICYFVLLGGPLLPYILSLLYRTPDLKLIQEGMALPTRLAVDYAWVIALLVALATIISIILAFRNRARRFQFTILGLCSQFILLWLTLFAFFYDSFLGPMDLFHGPEFDFREFFEVGFGMFPITLIGLLAAFITALIAKEDA